MLSFIDLSTNRKIRPVEWWGCWNYFDAGGEKSSTDLYFLSFNFYL